MQQRLPVQAKTRSRLHTFIGFVSSLYCHTQTHFELQYTSKNSVQTATTADKMIVSCRIQSSWPQHVHSTRTQRGREATRLRLLSANRSDQRVHHGELGADRAQLGRDVSEQRALRSKRRHRLRSRTRRQQRRANALPAHPAHRVA